MSTSNICKICTGGPQNSTAHKFGREHIKNAALQDFGNKKHKLNSNRKGISVLCTVISSCENLEKYEGGLIKISVKPKETIHFQYCITNTSETAIIEVDNVRMLHSLQDFRLTDCNGNYPITVQPNANLDEKISVAFTSANIGQYITPILFSFSKSSHERVTIVREMVVYVEETFTNHETEVKSPYTNKAVMADTVLRSPGANHDKGLFKIPPLNKTIFMRNLKIEENADEQEKLLAKDIQEVFDKGVTPENYVKFFHNVLWYEERMIGVNVRNYNMSGVNLVREGDRYSLYVPGLVEKRPSLMLGDVIFVRLQNNESLMFEGVIVEIYENLASIGKFHPTFSQHYTEAAKFDIRFFASRITLERMHVAVHEAMSLNVQLKIFPKEEITVNYNKPHLAFYNPLVENNPEQRQAVEHIVAGSSGSSPYLVHGPPGTGKTVTIVEAILQLVDKSQNNRIMVCTDSNMAADHIATLLIKYSHMFPEERFLLRASSQYRVWESLPECLEPYSNGVSRYDFERVSIEDFMSYRIVITTLSHAAKFGRQISLKNMHRHITHLFIDEAAQASEPCCLIPVSGLLSPKGYLVLAGDPHQLGPVIISRSANKIGLGTSLMERLIKNFPMYSHEGANYNYMVMLRNNFRSDVAILEIPDKLFYKGQLRALAKKDPLSDVDILGERPQSHATVFHGVLATEQRNGVSPSYFNEMEVNVVKLYIEALVKQHEVVQEDIGVISPYIRQVHNIKNKLVAEGYKKVDVGTVEAYQGKEKRVIIISTVRGNSSTLDYAGKYQLGFLVDEKRFNVVLTRAKAKLIIVGNPLCLIQDIRWRMYIDKCRELQTYHGFDPQTVDNKVDSESVLDIICPLLDEIKR